MLALPPVVRFTPASRRLAQPLVLQADGALKLGPGWQLAADTTISVAFGTAWLDLTAASWDANEINLRLETRAGAIEVVIPEGVAVQMVGGSGRVQLDSLSAPLPAGPVLRVSTSGPTGVIRIRHPRKRKAGPLTRWRRGRSARQAELADISPAWSTYRSASSLAYLACPAATARARRPGRRRRGERPAPLSPGSSPACWAGPSSCPPGRHLTGGWRRDRTVGGIEAERKPSVARGGLVRLRSRAEVVSTYLRPGPR